MKELQYPFDSSFILKKRKSLKRQLLADGSARIHKKIAILGGSTTHDIKDILELFLLDYGIEPEFYESEYAQYWQDVMFDNSELVSFAPDVIFIHTSLRNIRNFPALSDSAEAVNQKLTGELEQFTAMWQKIEQTYHCTVIQNNFELPFYRLLGNKDATDIHGKVHFVRSLNALFAEYAQNHKNFYINDVEYISASYGLEKWSSPEWWHLYKYALCLEAVPFFAQNLANIIKSVYGKNKKALVLDLDNTLWGGVVGDDGVDNIEIGQETPVGQVFSEFQEYVKSQKDVGVLLTVCSKNDEENALAGLRRPDSILNPDDFIVIKANWEPKSQNAVQIAKELNIGTDALVFVDDNPAEREIVRQNVAGCAVPEISAPERYVQILDRSGFFEVTELSSDDLARNEMYKANAERAKQQASFTDYAEYLRSLEMCAEIHPFSALYMARIAQLTNKSNQFNLTTRRCTQAELEEIAANKSCITLYGKLTDKFGDNGVVSVVFGHTDEVDSAIFHIDLWLMSCRVLKRDMECAMMDCLAEECTSRGISRIRGYYFPTAKNKMVREFYADRGFAKLSEDADGNTVWEKDLSAGYKKQNEVIKVN